MHETHSRLPLSLSLFSDHCLSPPPIVFFSLCLSRVNVTCVKCVFPSCRCDWCKQRKKKHKYDQKVTSSFCDVVDGFIFWFIIPTRYSLSSLLFLLPSASILLVRPFLLSASRIPSPFPSSFSFFVIKYIREKNKYILSVGFSVHTLTRQRESDAETPTLFACSFFSFDFFRLRSFKHRLFIHLCLIDHCVFARRNPSATNVDY